MNLSNEMNLLSPSVLILPFTAAGQGSEGPARRARDHALSSGSASPAPVDEKLPAGEENAKASLEKSPRHGEYVDIKLGGDKKPIRTWVVYPERKDKAPVVIVIHEIFGLSDWIRGVADQIGRGWIYRGCS